MTPSNLKYSSIVIGSSFKKLATKIHRWFFISWQEKHKDSIDAGTIPATRGGYFLELIYNHRFSWPLFLIIAMTASIFFLADIEVVRNKLDSVFNNSPRAKGTFLLAIMSTPAITYAWFIRAYERGISIVKEEAELWSKELNGLINQAVDADKQMALRLVAIRQMQDYLSGAKWRANQAANSSAILQAFSSIIDGLETKADIDKTPASTDITHSDNETRIENNPIKIPRLSSPLLDVIGSVMRGALHKRKDGIRTLKTIGNSISGLNLSHTDLNGLDISGLDCSNTKLNRSQLILANLRRSNLYAANVNFSNLNRADLTHAILNVAYFTNTSTPTHKF